MASAMELKENFEAWLRTIVEGKGKNTRLFSLEKVKDIISRLSKDLESDAITTIDYNYRSRYGNLKSLPDEDYKYILTYVNHFTKYCVLSPLKSKRAEEVAQTLLPAFLTFGAPAVLQSDNGREFVNSVISEYLNTAIFCPIFWPQLQLVTGRPRHPQSQGAVERLNGVIQDKLKIWMRENNSKKWNIGLKFVQWQVNISKHEKTKHAPFKATFEEEPSVVLSSTNLPESVLDGICYEEDLDKFVARSTAIVSTLITSSYCAYDMVTMFVRWTLFDQSNYHVTHYLLCSSHHYLSYRTEHTTGIVGHTHLSIASPMWTTFTGKPARICQSTPEHNKRGAYRKDDIV
ncbi:SCAN domain-containing protein 3-like [Macrobrachium nipponense]|uniref:SCAN domain-containing protein 3-like n=1 Tax=Macrobrachium nipponense TaxID=159736 RepID=UPI0030C7B044